MEERFNFNVILNSFIILIPINIFVILLTTLYRIIFLLFYGDFSSLVGMKMYILKAFIMGFRFDLSVLAYINAPIVLLLIVCLLLRSIKFFKSITVFCKYYFTIILSLFFFVIIFDFGFFSYFKDHYNFLIFGLFEDDTVALIKTILCDYRVYFLILIFITLCIIFYKISKWTSKELLFNERIINTLYWKNSSKFFVIIAIMAINFICARGSFSMFPLGLFYSQISPDYFINKLCINPVHPLADTIYYKIKSSQNAVDLKEVFKYDNSKIIEDLKILSTNQDIEKIEDVYTKKTAENKVVENLKPNVILIIMEGMGEMPIKYNSTNFNVLGELEQHFKKDIVFYNFLPSGSISIQAVETTILNIPQRPLVNQITQTQNATKKYISSAVLPYKKAGYEIVSLYGGSMTWRDLEGFFKTQGFDKILSEGNIQLSHKDKHAWGISDKQFFKMLKEELFDETAEKPKFIYAMSTGAHPPYKTPADYKPLPLEIPQDIANIMSKKDFNNKAIFELYQVANRELAKFISDIKNSKFAQNTIIAVTGDHNLRELADCKKEDMFLRYAVPFYLYIPKELQNKKIDTSILGSHLDIMPTLYNLSLDSVEYCSFGNDLTTVTDNIIVNSEGLVMKDNIAIKYNFINNSFESFNFNKKTKKLEITDETENHKLLAQYYKAFIISTDNFIKSHK